MPINRAYFYITFRVPIKGVPSRFPSHSTHVERFPTEAPFNDLSEFPMNGPLSKVHTGTRWKEMLVSGVHIIPGRQAPYQAQQQGPQGNKCAFPERSSSYIFGHST
jgi:hypothetical protein